jgi:transcriptional regulator with XRE-family HTH domain
MLPELIALNQIRLDRDLSYDQLAEALGKYGKAPSPTTINNYLLGRNEPSDRNLHKIRRFLDDQAPVSAPTAKPAKSRRG